MKKKIGRLGMVAGVTALMLGCAGMQQQAQVSPVDQHFLLNAAAVGTAEVALGELAMQKAQDPAIREFGQHMVTDHNRVNGELMMLAAAKGVVLPKAMDPANKVLHSELSALSGAAFDRQYIISQVNIHNMGNGLYLSEAQSGLDLEVKNFAAKNTPVGIEHLKMAQSLVQ